jgi:hypothetical protein
MRFIATLVLILVSSSAWSQPVSVERAYVAVFPTEAIDVDDVLALQRGIELVLCQAGLRPGTESASELKIAASLAKASFAPDRERRQIVRDCQLTDATATLRGGAQTPLPDLALGGRTSLPATKGAREAASESFFVACGITFARGAIDALKDHITIRASSCEEPPKPKPAPSRKKRAER